MSPAQLRAVVAAACVLLAWRVTWPTQLSANSAPGCADPAAAVWQPERRSDVLNVHLVPHTHDDVGWCARRCAWVAVVLLLLPDSPASPSQKVENSRPVLPRRQQQHPVRGRAGESLELTVHEVGDLGPESLVNACAAIQYILSAVLDALERDPTKRFTYVEMAFFTRWFASLPPARQAVVRTLVDQRRLVFANGGWCMHDEASSYYADAIDQSALGHAFIASEFGMHALPSVGWQIDPFGHSSLQASLLGPGLGISAVFFGRADYADLWRRQTARQLEFKWVPATPDAEPGFYGMLFGTGNYGPPDGFNWDLSGDEPIDDDPESGSYNAPRIVDGIVNVTLEWAKRFKGAGPGGDLMLLLGSDFEYQTNMWWINVDKLLRLLQADGRINVFYSTPDAYLAAKRATRWGEEEGAIETVTADLFPYADSPHAYWTGYLSSRGALKQYIRDSSSALHAARQLAGLHTMQALPLGASVSPSALRRLEEAMGVAQHHDAVAGTSKQHVACDYARRLAAGRATAAVEVNAAMASLAQLELPADECPLLNASICAATASLLPGKSVTVTVWNPLGWSRTARVRVPVPSTNIVLLRVTDASGALLPSQVARVSTATAAVRAWYASDGIGDEASGLDGFSSEEDAPLELFFSIELPPLGTASVVLSASEPLAGPAGGAAARALQSSSSTTDEDTPAISGSGLSVYLGPTGGVTRLHDAVTDTELALTMSVVQYTEHDGDEANMSLEDPGQAGGAYIFRPVGTPTTYPMVLSGVVQGPVMQEARFRAAPWAHFALRLWNEPSEAARAQRHVEVDYTVGPLPQTGNAGSSITLRLDTGVDSGGVWWTDAQGWQMQRRQRNARETWDWNATEAVAGNFVPSMSLSALASASGDGPTFGVLPDRAMGVASLQDGSLELMLHRRLFHDDGRGVEEALNETLCCCRDTGDDRPCIGMVLRGTLRLVFAPPPAFARLAQPLRVANERPPAVVFGRGAEQAPPSVSFLTSALPPNVHLVTLAPSPMGSNTLLLRLAHVYEPVNAGTPAADAQLSSEAVVHLDGAFASHDGAHVRVVSVTEVLHNGLTPKSGASPAVSGLTVLPGQLRTWLVQVATRAV